MGTMNGIAVSPCAGRKKRGAAWAPDATDLLSWVELRNGYTTDVGVTNIPDLGSMGGAMAQTLDADEPAESTIGSQPAAQFDGANSTMLHSAGAAAWKKLHDGTGCTFYFVVNEPTNGDTSGNLLATARNSTPASDVGFDIFRSATQWILRISNASGTLATTQNFAVTAGLGVYCIRFDVGNAVALHVRRNGAQVLSVATIAGTPSSADPVSALRLGESVGTGNHLNMLWGGHLLYGARHSDEVVAANEAQLMALYGVT